jgi:hypothetical protein
VCVCVCVCVCGRVGMCGRARAHEIMHKMRIVKYIGQVMQIL